MKNYLTWLILGMLAIAYLVYNQQIVKSVGTPSFIDEFSMPSKNLNRNVKIWVYLPPDYLQATEKLPVLYMHDGQNLFDANLSFAGEWQVDESLDELYHETGFQAVVIGIENGGEKRIEELTPFPNAKHGGGKADNYLNFILNELMPLAENKYNISTEKQKRAMLGSSLGGLITFYAAFKHEDQFSKFGVYSPSFWFNDRIFDLPKNQKLSSENRMFIAIGDDEKQEHLNVIKMEKTLNSTQNFPLQTEIIPKGQHNEAFWANQFKEDVRWLFEL